MVRFAIASLLVLACGLVQAAAPRPWVPNDPACVCGDSCACPVGDCPSKCPVAFPVPPPAPPAGVRVCDAAGCRVIDAAPISTVGFPALAAAGQLAAFRDAAGRSGGPIRNLFAAVRERMQARADARASRRGN